MDSDSHHVNPVLRAFHFVIFAIFRGCSLGAECRLSHGPGSRQRKNVVTLLAASSREGHVLTPANLVHGWNSIRTRFDLRFPNDFPSVLVEGVDITVSR